ncbi:MAG: SGNH/GDSL hydrolase family protein [Verrucomicrobiales bacterium]|nr:SGNH/GDSL hydrolase family protein [Verrucomicrobiales bacterium]
MKIRFWLLFVLLVVTSRLGATDLPKALLIGDSISIGYTPHVVAALKGRVEVIHHKGNAQHTGTGLKMLDRWIGGKQWDVIHFNWGLWDLCYRHPDSRAQGRRDKEKGALTTSIEQYEKNLDQLVVRLKKTGAKLIWAHTTTVPDGEAGRKLGDDDRYNDAASRVMKKHGIEINDLNALSDSFPAGLFTAPGNVHFKAEGSRRLGQAVAAEITAALVP